MGNAQEFSPVEYEGGGALEQYLLAGSDPANAHGNPSSLLARGCLAQLPLLSQILLNDSFCSGQARARERSTEQSVRLRRGRLLRPAGSTGPELMSEDKTEDLY